MDFTDIGDVKLITDASVTGIGAVLTQNGRPIAFESKKLTDAERNWTTTEQEMWAVVHALHVWRCYLEGIKFEIHTDHNPLVYLKTQPNLSRKQARWSEYLQRFEFDWKYIKGTDNSVADPLSRRHEAEPLNAITLKSVVLRSNKGKQKAQPASAEPTVVPTHRKRKLSHQQHTIPSGSTAKGRHRCRAAASG
jgi:hypothetical protein